MNKDFQGDVSQQASLYLKLIVNQNWTDDASEQTKTTDSQKPFSMADKENVGSHNAQQRSGADQITQVDRNMLKQDIFGALDNVVHMTDPASKVIVSSIENIIYNIAQLDYTSWASYAQD